MWNVKSRSYSNAKTSKWNWDNQLRKWVAEKEKEKEHTMKDYISFSSWSQYKKCEAKALAMDKGEWTFEQTEAMLVSKYIEALVIGTEEEVAQFFIENPIAANSRTGEPKAAFKNAEHVAEKCKADPVFMAMLQGDTQYKLEGVINGVKVKGIADVVQDYITDLKAMANFTRAWNPVKRHKESFIEQRDYATQGAIYRELYYQMYEERLPFFLAATTKEEYPKRVVADFPEEVLDIKLAQFADSLPHIMEVRAGTVPPKTCNDCDYCRTMQHAVVQNYRLVGLSKEELELLEYSKESEED